MNIKMNLRKISPQRIQRLVDMFFPGRNVDEHQGLAVAPEAVLKEVGELRVSVRDVRVLLGEGHDDVPEVGQGLVDVLGLSQPHPLASTFLYPLAAGKIHLESF